MNERKKILVFEDDWNTIKGSFELANTFAFDDQLEIRQVAKSQDIPFVGWRDEYSAVFVDITLAKRTQMDGFSIVKKIQDQDIFDLSKVVVLTGNGSVKEKLDILGVDTNSVKVIYKPVSFDELADVLQSILQ